MRLLDALHLYVRLEKMENPTVEDRREIAKTMIPLYMGAVLLAPDDPQDYGNRHETIEFLTTMAEKT